MKRREALKAVAAAGASVCLPGFAAEGFEHQSVPPDDAAALRALARLRGEPPARANVRFEGGGMRLYVNGREEFPLLCVSTNLLATAAGYRASGIRFLHPLIGLAAGWTGPGRYDWRRIIAYFGRLLTVVPDAVFLPRLHLYAPDWWKDAHPDELIAYALPPDPAGYGMKPRRIDSGFDWNTIVDTRSASLASEIWRADQAAALRDFLRTVEASPLRARMAGYHVAGGLNGEWHYTGSHFLPDTSAPMARRTGPPPDAEARRTTTRGLLRDPAAESAVIAFYRRMHECTAEAAAGFCRAVKEETQGRVLAGLFYNYLLENVMIHEAGHLAPRLVLESPHIDFVAAPYSYLHTTRTADRPLWESDVYDEADNRLGRARGVGGDGGLRVLAESLRRHRKLFFSEMDASTYLEPRRSTEGGSGNDTVEGTLRILRRDLAQVIATGIGGWLFDFGHFDPPYKAGRGWYDDAPMIHEIARWNALGQGRPRRDLSPAAEIAFVADTESFFVTPHWKAAEPWQGYGVSIMDVVNHWFLAAQSRAVHRIGAPVDFLYPFDLTEADLHGGGGRAAGEERATGAGAAAAPRYRFVIFPNLFFLTDADAERLTAILRGSGATVLWYYAPGIASPERLDPGRMERLTGFRFRALDEPGPLMIRAELADEGEDPLRVTFGIWTPAAPRFVIEVDGETESDVRVLGEWEDGRGPAFAAREHDGFTSIYVGAAPLPAEILRRLAERAGVHPWSTKCDVVRATRDAAMIIASDDGERTLRFPTPFAPAFDPGKPALEHRLSMAFGDVLAFLRAQA